MLLFFPVMAMAQTFETAHDAVANMRVGWNLGNTLDSHSGDTLNMWIESNKYRNATTYETAWGQKMTQAKLFKMLKEAGFNAVRVPVTWYPHMEASFSAVRGYDNQGKWSYTPWLPSKDDIGQQIQKAWMKRVHEVVDYVIDQGMYCILNIHHDTGADNTAWLIADQNVYKKQHERFEAIWTQIAEEFKDYDEHLLFEGYNEMLDAERSWCYAQFGAKAYDDAKAKAAYTAINDFAQSFVDAVRATGGNNTQRNLVVSTYGACDGSGNWNSHLQDPLKQMKLPNDPVGEGHIIFEVHSYPKIDNLTSTKSTVNSMMNNLKKHLVAKGAPVIIGEWGISGDELSRANHVEFVKFFAKSCKANGIGLFHWMGLTDGAYRAIPEFNEQDLVDAMMEGYYGTGGYQVEVKSVRQLDDKPVDVYLLNGVKLLKGTTLMQAYRMLPKGVYIIGGKKFVRS
ncbi:MAG: glycoside hydrolase family 5 protein [Bacteroidaceae bacterium]|nr:glycoside hydrolase family 5 protein [Bacteroidaceae bacterium]